jgi:AcrR family transcriptional regulator
MPDPAYSRLPVDERRRRLLELGPRLFAEHAYDELSMADIAKAAGISKALLYHYFPSKRAFFAASLRQTADDVARRTAPDPDLPPLEALAASIDAYLGWIEENPTAWAKLIQSAGTVEEARALVDEVRESTTRRVLTALAMADSPVPKLRAAVHGWLWFMDGTIIDWLEHRDFERAELRNLLVDAFVGMLGVAGGSQRLPA